VDKNCILEFNNKDSVSDKMIELLRNGAQQLFIESNWTRKLSKVFSDNFNKRETHFDSM